MRKESNSDHNTCTICKEHHPYVSLGQCDHRVMCNVCTMRSRMLYSDKKCPICMTKSDEVYIIPKEEENDFAVISKNKEYYYKDAKYEENGIYYTDIESKEQALELINYICPIEGCQEAAFENLQRLIQHLKLQHGRYYCETCLKESKSFISEMPIYTKDQLREHLDFGEYSKSNELKIPPHPSCQFCNIRYYNEDYLYKHMNEVHFMCQICKERKTIVFYKEVAHLLDHYKFRHYVCPFKECLDDIFVVFESEEKLYTHLATKHKVRNAVERMTSFAFDHDSEYGTSSSNYQQTKKPKAETRREDYEFNFTEYTNLLKQRLNDYLSNKKEHENDYFDYDNVKPFDYNSGYGKGSNSYYMKKQPNKKSGQKKQYDPFDYALSSGVSDVNKFGNVTQQQSNQPKFEQREINIQYVLGIVLQMLKEFVVEHIKSGNYKEEEIMLPRETIYQIIVIVDRLDLSKMKELQYLNNFGIDPETFRNLKNAIMLEENSMKIQISRIIENLSVKKILIIYKYISICVKKLREVFYKLDHDQVDEDMFEEFMKRTHKKKHQSSGLSHKINLNPKPLHSNEPKKQNTHLSHKNDPKQNINNFKSGKPNKLNSIFNENKPKTVEKSQIYTTTSSQPKDHERPNSSLLNKENISTKTKSKLKLLLDSDGSKIEQESFDEIVKKSKFSKAVKNYDEEFPEL